MKFEKLPTSIEDQITLLRGRGMHFEDELHAKRCLESIGYYRLSAYWLPSELIPENGETRSKKFYTGTNFDTVFALYVFDRKLRLLILEAIERIEIHVRSRWTYHMAHDFGAHAHLNYKLFNGRLNHAEQLVRLARSVESSKETFVLHYKQKYDDPFSPPLWVATELMTLGELSKWFKATKANSIKSRVGAEIGLPSKEIAEGVIESLSYVRNICAHHGRLWNRKLVKRPPWIRRYKNDLQMESGQQPNQPENTVYNIIVVILHILGRQNTDSTFSTRLIELLEGEDNESIYESMGFPRDWRSRPLFHPSPSVIESGVRLADGVHLA